MRYRLLGPLESRTGVEWVSPGSPQQRLTLAVLLLHAPHPVSVTALLGELWPERSPQDGAEAVRRDVDETRAFLREHGDDPIHQDDDGYRIDVGAEDLDLTMFTAAVDAGGRQMRSGLFRQAIDSFHRARTLWRDTPFSDVPASPLILTERPRVLATMRRCQLGLIDARLATDDLGDLGGEIDAELARHPLSEDLWIRKALLCNQLGSRADAMNVFHQAHATLATELGIEPSEEMRRLYAGILDGESPAALLHILGVSAPTSAVSALSAVPPRPEAFPSELPPASPYFEGRAQEIAVLGDLLDTTDARACTVVTVNGMAGSGKTTLAVRACRAAAEQYPDGQLFVDLRGHSGDEPLSPLAAVGRVLYSLGVPGDEIPGDLHEATARYRTISAGRRLLILADDARDVAQVSPLVPAGAGSRLVVTSRGRLGGLPAPNGVRSLPLDPLPEAEARALLTEIIGPEPAARPDVLDTLVRLGGGLPLSLRILAAQLRQAPERRFAELTRRLASGRLLSALEILGDPQASVRTALDQSYATLPEEVRRLFRRLSWLPGREIDARAAAVVLGCDVESADRLLARLEADQLLQQHGTHRYRLHDAVREFAEERSEQEDPHHERTTAVNRVLRWHLGRAWTAIGQARTFCPAGLDEELTEFDPATFALPAGWTTLRWWDLERATIAAATRCAMQYGLHRVCWMLSYCLTTYLQQRLRLTEWQETSDLGMSAALAADDREGRAWLKNAEGKLLAQLRRLPESIEALTESVRTFGELGRAEAELMAVGNLGIVHSLHGDDALGVELLERAVAQSERLDAPQRLHIGLNNLTMGYLQTGRVDEAVATGRRSLEVLVGLDYPQLNDDRGRALDSLGQAYRRAGLLHEAVRAHAAALRDFEIADNSVDRIVCLNNLGECQRLLGNHDSAVAMFSLALDYQRIAEDDWSIAHALGRLGTELIEAGRAGEARAPLTEAAELLRRLDVGRADELTTLVSAEDLTGRADALAELFTIRRS
ncbi:DNA-binding SARP family transcriptional activator/tetratricopeptide (TPR) repeat protein [Actinoalloteichus hoggarensis]|uniref:Regulatory protein AfsR n=1 Tax=Actinoalloteichus hoggarensis TaxID=1470176 RepID=A0A221VZF0_9PSEU|nr:BTAD domain-containing putative transcriptional regulator [Actinoalloteichus hoggarensis]ASO18884.1 Regulatory protein AfsR [Actinoalloteichus hoggarensis]MBB5920119.1 DNA-binding SARP family transcriptional activator/tetratricopeptide (TPR) repeat protein [Actinoalloteichus hoggarensis]